MSYIQLPHGLVKNDKQVQFNLHKDYEEARYIKRLPYIQNKDPHHSDSIIDLIKNRDDFKKYLLATSVYGNELQQDLNAIVGHNGKFNNAIVRPALDLKNDGIMQNPNPLNLTFRDVKKFDIQNPVIGKLVSQVKASKLTDEKLTKRILAQDEIANIENRLGKLNKPININAKDDNDDDNNGGSGGGGGNVLNRNSRRPDPSPPPPDK